ncbi:MAG: hypothetical protein HUJ76_09820 [Parasporobacterium sp.]|nr:hypothetical protein [Parasporobacterium sp.]
MGCRTGVRDYYTDDLTARVQQNRKPQGSVDGSVVRKASPEYNAPVKIKRRGSGRADAAMKKALKRQKRLFIALGIAASAAVIMLCAVMLTVVETNGDLSSQIRRREADLDDLKVYNNAKEYEIGRSVDLNEIIRIAVNELGMVRCSEAQIVSYGVKESEYLMQVARVPAE